MELNTLEIQETAKEIIIKILVDSLEQIANNKKEEPKEWMTIEEARNYIGVSYNTFNKFRIMGLKVAEIDNVKRVAKSEIDRFLTEHSF